MISTLKKIAKKSTVLRILMRSTLYGIRGIVYRFRGIGICTEQDIGFLTFARWITGCRQRGRYMYSAGMEHL